MFRFDEQYYLTANPDLTTILRRLEVRPETHYHQQGAAEGRSPHRYFDEAWYLAAYVDVAQAVRAGAFRSGYHHYILRGADEGRDPNAQFSEKSYLQSRPDVAAAVSRGEYRCGYEHFILGGELDDETSGAASQRHAPEFTPQPVDTPHVGSLSLVIDRRLAEQPRLNVILPSLQMKHMSGGPNTAISISYRLAQQGVPTRFLSANTPVDEDLDCLWRHILSVSGGDQKMAIEIGNANSISGGYPIGENDVFFATAWWTAQMISQVLVRMRTKRFFYLIQDYEPALSAWSSEYCMALETYSLDFLPIFNTHLLRDYFVSHRIGRFVDPKYVHSSVAFEPAIDRQYFFPEPRIPTRKHRLLFYARPLKAPRNLFDIGLAALKRCADSGIFDNSEWELNYIGENLAETRLSPTVVIRSRPWLSYAAYARLMRQSDLLLSLMLSPHPSYPPLEMASCGGIVVTNTFDCKTSARLQAYSQNILPTEPRIQSIADALSEAVARIELGLTRFSPVSLPSSWSESFLEVLPQLVAVWTETTQAAMGRQ